MTLQPLLETVLYRSQHADHELYHAVLQLNVAVRQCNMLSPTYWTHPIVVDP